MNSSILHKIQSQKRENFTLFNHFVRTNVPLLNLGTQPLPTTEMFELDLDKEMIQKIIQNQYPQLALDFSNELFLLLILTNPFTCDFSFQTSSPKKLVSESELDLGLHYHGMFQKKSTNELDEESSVALSFFHTGEVFGLFYSTGNKQHALIPIPTFLLHNNDQKQNTYLFYQEDQSFIESEYKCKTLDDLKYPYTNDELFGKIERKDETRHVRVYMETDSSVYSHFNQKLTKVSQYVLTLFNAQALFYEKNAGIPIQLSALYIWDKKDPYSTEGANVQTILQQFQTYRTDFQGDVAQLIGFNGEGGLASSLNVFTETRDITQKMSYSKIIVAKNSAYPLPLFSSALNGLNHQLGHLFGSVHTEASAWNGNQTPFSFHPYLMSKSLTGFHLGDQPMHVLFHKFIHAPNLNSCIVTHSPPTIQVLPVQDSPPSINPTLLVSPSVLSISTVSNVKYNSKLLIWSPSGSINWTASSTLLYVTILPSFGTATTNQTIIQIQINTTNLIIGKYSGQLIFSPPLNTPNVAPITVELHLTITGNNPCKNGKYFNGTLPANGTRIYNQMYKTSITGTHSLTLSNASSNVQLIPGLMQWIPQRDIWVPVAKHPNVITYTGVPGFYISFVDAINGSGSYSLCVQPPPNTIWYSAAGPSIIDSTQPLSQLIQQFGMKPPLPSPINPPQIK